MRPFLTRAGLAGLLLVALVLPIRAGANNGPFRKTVTVQGFQSYTIRVSFQAGKPAQVQVEGDGDTPLSLVILDAQNRRVASDSRDPDRPSVRFTPTSQGTYKIKIINRGGVPNQVVVRTN
jgi:hypothetical protein